MSKVKNELKMIKREIWAYSRTLLKKAPSNKFVIFSQGRTGSNLVRQLLHSHPQVVCHGELLLRYYLRVIWPKLYLEGQAAGQSKEVVYGFQLQPVHFTFHRLAPNHFLNYLHEHQWHIIHLKRNNIFRQIMSAKVAISKNQWLYSKSAKESDTDLSIHIDSTELIKELEKTENNYLQEQEMLASLPYLEIIYEDDLLNAEQHQDTADKIFDYLGISSTPIQITLAKSPFQDMEKIIKNYQEIREALSNTKYAAYLDQ